MTNGNTGYEVIVIGGGIAGMVAANRAAELGKRVAVLEKGTAEKYICNSRYTYGTFHINFSDVMAEEDALFARIRACTEGFAREDLARTVARYGSRLMRWLRAEDVELVDLGQYHTNVLSPVWRSGAGFKWDGYAGDVTLRKLEANLNRRGGTVIRGTHVNALKAGPAIEIQAAQPEGAATFHARAVVIADGGFQANMEMVRQFISPAPEKLLPRHGGTAMGDGLRMAQAIGAATTGMANFYGHLHSRDAMSNPLLWPRPQTDDLAAAGIVVDAEGRRVADEGLGGIYLSNAIARLADPLSTTVIFDHAIWEGPPGRGHAQPPNPLLPDVGGTIHRADTIAVLATVVGMPRLKETVEQYNAAIDAGTLGKLSPPRLGPAKAWPIRTAPFYAVPLCSAITNTMGGIAVNGDGAVLDTGGKPIPGVYAAGSTVGGLNGGPYSGYVGGLINATVGLRAGDVIGGFNG